MAAPAPYSWESLWQGLGSLRRSIRGVRSERIGDLATRESAKQIVQGYFRGVRPDLVRLNLVPQLPTLFDFSPGN